MQGNYILDKFRINMAHIFTSFLLVTFSEWELK